MSDVEVRCSHEIEGKFGTEPHGSSWRQFSILETWTRTDIACALLVVVFVCEMTTGQANRYAPTLAPLVACIPLGLVLLVRDAIAGDHASRLAILFLGSGLVSVILSEAPIVALVGASQRHTSWLVFVGGFCTFVLARRVSPNGARLVAGALVFAVCLSGVMAIVEVVVQPISPAFALIDVRPRGLSLHPVYLAQFAAGVCGLACWRIAKHDDLIGYTLVGLMSFFVGLTASRVATLSVLVLVAFTIAISYRNSKRVRLLPAIAFLGVALSWILHSAVGTSRSVADRVTSEGMQDRLDAWSYGLRGWQEHPLFGWGPGRFSIATQRYIEPAFARRFEPEWWDDAHNVFVEVLTSWGMVGFLFFVWFVVVAARSSKGPMLWVASGVAFSWLLEPTTPATIGILGITVGIASTGRVGVSDTGLSARLARSALVGVGVIAASLILVGGTRTRLLNGPVPTGPESGWSIWYRYDWVLASIYAKSLPSDSPQAEFWAHRALDLEPEHSSNHALVALQAFKNNDLLTARLAAERSLELQSTRELALIVLHNIAATEGESVREAEMKARLCELAPAVFCAPADPND